MDHPDRAVELLKKGQKAVVLFTKGKKFNSNSTGYSGNWNVAQEFSHVIVYYRDAPKKSGGQIYIGEFTQFGEPIQPEANPDLKSIEFKNFEYKGHTTGSMWDFTGIHARRFCYVEGQ